MAEYAIIGSDGTTISNVIVVDSLVAQTIYPHAIQIDSVIPTPGINWRYDQVSKTFTPPVS